MMIPGNKVKWPDFCFTACRPRPGNGWMPLRDSFAGRTEEAGSDGMGTSDEYDPVGSRRNREGRNHLLLRWHDESDPINVENRTDSDGHDCDGDPVGRVFPARCFFHRLSSDCRIVPDDLSAVLFDGDLHRIGVDSDDAHRICD